MNLKMLQRYEKRMKNSLFLDFFITFAHYFL